MPWLSGQVLQRAHGTLLTELRPQLCDELVLSGRQLMGSDDVVTGRPKDPASQRWS